ncbi:hypothetical protein [Desulfovibrio sp. ZJ200]|uniref:hypothetical protein n=1 Tax=Desulfovibrio sp. ZJ200 TaxID=2709792 RepID=UPI0013EBE6C9|nr:hypothetical protein [Desulfovibrio sp. ZJ200]
MSLFFLYGPLFFGTSIEHFHFENALLTRKRQPPQRGVHSGENRVFRLNATFDFHKKSKVICSRCEAGRPDCGLTEEMQCISYILYWQRVDFSDRETALLCHAPETS